MDLALANLNTLASTMSQVDPSRAAVLGTVLAWIAGLVVLGIRSPKPQEHHLHQSKMPEGYTARTEGEQQIINAYDEAQALPWIPFLMRNIRWTMSTYIVMIHVLAAFALPHLLDCKTQTLFGIAVFYFISGFGITGGAHRLWSHKSYKASASWRYFVMICNSVANQGTIYHWSRDHRTHHKYSETRADPHNAERGFFFAHVGWLLLKKDPRVKLAGQHINMDDLKMMPEVVLQKRFDPVWNLFWCFAFPALTGHFLWGESLLKAFMLMGPLRYVLILNGTWLVNSAAHLYGEHTYDEHANPSENPAVAIISLGEGYHSYHHSFPNDYAASELGVSAQYNPTKLLIDLGAVFGLVTDRKRSLKLWEMRQKNRGITKTVLQGPPMLKIRKVVERRSIAAAGECK